MSDIEQIIADSVNDSINGVEEPTPEVETQVDASEEAAPEAVEGAISDSTETEAQEVAEGNEIDSPAKREAAKVTPESVQDEFEKLVGMPKEGVGGRENRIPYSRVKKIVDKRASEVEGGLAEVVLGRKLNDGEKAADAVKAHVAQIPELQTKIADYEGRLQQVGEFENVLANDPERFMGMLEKLPAYSRVFDLIGKGLEFEKGSAAPQAEAAPPADPNADMPQPDEELSDGSMVYSMAGLQKLLAWNSQQTEARVATAYEAKLKGLSDKYDPVVTEWQENKRIAAARPIIEKQLADARKLPLFNESEDEILEVLRNDKRISLEAAYNKVVMPKLVAERNNIRESVIKELKTAPTATSVVSRAATKAVDPNKPKSVEDIIREQVQTLKQ